MMYVRSKDNGKTWDAEGKTELSPWLNKAYGTGSEQPSILTLHDGTIMVAITKMFPSDNIENAEFEGLYTMGL